MAKCFIVVFSILLITTSHRVKSQNVFEAVRKGDTVRLELLYKLKADTIQSKNENDFTPLIIAVYRNQADVTEWLLKKGVEVNAVSPEGSALVAAAYKGNLPLAELLLKWKANPDVSNTDGVTALMFAAMSNNTEMAGLLLKHNASKNLKSKFGKSALDYALMYGFEKSAALLR